MNAKTKTAAAAKADKAITGTVETAQEVATQAPASTAVATAKDRPAFTVKRRVTLELFKTVPGVECFYKVEGAIYQGKPIKDNAPEGTKKKEPAFLMNVTDLQSGVMGQIIVGNVLKSTLTEEYPDDSYVGKSFCIKMRKIPGKDYNGYDIAEIELS